MTTSDSDPTRRNYRKQQQREVDFDKINILHHKCCHEGEKVHFAHHEGQRLEQQLSELIEDDKAIAFAKGKDYIPHICRILLILGSWITTTVLINSPAKYLIARNFGDGPLLTVGVVLFTITLTGTQVAVAILYAEAQQKTATLQHWHVVAHTMASFTAGMVLASEIARYVGLRQLPWPHDILVVAGLMALGYGFDWLIVFHGDELRTALGFFIFQVQHGRLLRASRQMKGAFHHHLAELRSLYAQYQQKLAAYTKVAGADALAPLPLDNTTQWVVDEWLGGSGRHPS